MTDDKLLRTSLVEVTQTDREVAIHVQHISARLQPDFPQVDHDVVTALVREALDRTREARVQQFRALLAERDVREGLRRDLVDQRAAESPMQKWSG
jgi:hypothetical protein